MVSVNVQGRTGSASFILGLLDVGTSHPNARLEIRTADKPTSFASTPGILLAVHEMSKPAFGPVSGGQAISNIIHPENSILANGQAGWFRMRDCDGTPVIDGTITGIGGGGDMEVKSIQFEQGKRFLLNTITAIMPE